MAGRDGRARVRFRRADVHVKPGGTEPLGHACDAFVYQALLCGSALCGLNARANGTTTGHGQQLSVPARAETERACAVRAPRLAMGSSATLAMMQALAMGLDSSSALGH